MYPTSHKPVYAWTFHLSNIAPLDASIKTDMMCIGVSNAEAEKGFFFKKEKRKKKRDSKRRARSNASLHHSAVRAPHFHPFYSRAEEGQMCITRGSAFANSRLVMSSGNGRKDKYTALSFSLSLSLFLCLRVNKCSIYMINLYTYIFHF